MHEELCNFLKILYDYTNKFYMHNLESILENETQKTSIGFYDIDGSPNISQTTRLNDSQQKKEDLLLGQTTG